MNKQERKVLRKGKKQWRREKKRGQHKNWFRDE